MEKLQTLCAKKDAAKEEIAWLTKLTLFNSGKRGKSDSKIRGANKVEENLFINLQKLRDELKSLEDARFMLDGANLQIQ